MDFTAKLDPDVSAILRDLEKSVDEASDDLMKEFSDELPDDMRSLMKPGGVSKKGEPPRRQSGELADSIEAQVISNSSVQISMANHAQHLDPVFGGYLNRPFIEKSIDERLKKMESSRRST